MTIKFIDIESKIPHSKIYHYDVVILGGGPAGLTAAIYAVRYGIKAALITKEIGGMASKAKKIENYPGYDGSGAKLMKHFFSRAKKFGTEFLNDDVISLKRDNNGIIVAVSNRKVIHTKSIIIALGTQRRKLNIKGEDKFLGKGVSYCASCDGFFFRDKNVAVIGGGNAACHAALILSEMCSKVYVICRGEKSRCDEVLIRKLNNKDNIEFIYNSIPTEIKGKGKVSELIVFKNRKKEKIKVSGVFIEIGGLPLSDIAKMLKLRMDKDNYIHVNEHMETNVKGVFAAGDVVRSKLKQIVVAAAQGALAAKSAHEYVSGL